MPMLALLAPMMAPKSETEVTKAPPIFKRRWWYSAERLDARPVIWSLQNHPEEWQYIDPDYRNRIVHTPSEHEVWTGSQQRYRLRAECSCSSRNWQVFQAHLVGRAIRQWQAQQREQQFRSHFVP